MKTLFQLGRHFLNPRFRFRQTPSQAVHEDILENLENSEGSEADALKKLIDAADSIIADEGPQVRKAYADHLKRIAEMTERFSESDILALTVEIKKVMDFVQEGEVDDLRRYLVENHAQMRGLVGEMSDSELGSLYENYDAITDITSTEVARDLVTVGIENRWKEDEIMMVATTLKELENFVEKSNLKNQVDEAKKSIRIIREGRLSLDKIKQIQSEIPEVTDLEKPNFSGKDWQESINLSTQYSQKIAAESDLVTSTLLSGHEAVQLVNSNVVDFLNPTDLEVSESVAQGIKLATERFVALGFQNPKTGPGNGDDFITRNDLEMWIEGDVINFVEQLRINPLPLAVVLGAETKLDWETIIGEKDRNPDQVKNKLLAKINETNNPNIKSLCVNVIDAAQGLLEQSDINSTEIQIYTAVLDRIQKGDLKSIREDEVLTRTFDNYRQQKPNSPIDELFDEIEIQDIKDDLDANEKTKNTELLQQSEAQLDALMAFLNPADQEATKKLITQESENPTKRSNNRLEAHLSEMWPQIETTALTEWSTDVKNLADQPIKDAEDLQSQQNILAKYETFYDFVAPNPKSPQSGSFVKTFQEISQKLVEASSNAGAGLEDSVEIRNPEIMLRNLPRMMAAQSTEQSIAWGAAMLTRMNENYFQSEDLASTYDQLADAIKTQLEQKILGSTEDPNFTVLCTQAAKMYCGRLPSAKIRDQQKDTDFALRMLEKAVNFEALALENAEVEHTPNPLFGKINSLQDDLKGKIPEAAQSDPNIAPYLAMDLNQVEGLPLSETLSEISTCYTVLRSLEAQINGQELDPNRITAEIQQTVIPWQKANTEAFKKFLDGGLFRDETTNTQAKLGVTFDPAQKAAFDLMIDIGGYGLDDFSDKTWQTTGDLAMLGAQIGGAVLIGMATGGAGFGVVASMVAGGAGMAGLNIVMNRTGVDNSNDAWKTYGSEFAIGAASMGTMRYLQGLRAVAQAGGKNFVDGARLATRGGKAYARLLLRGDNGITGGKIALYGGGEGLADHVVMGVAESTVDFARNDESFLSNLATHWTDLNALAMNLGLGVGIEMGTLRFMKQTESFDKFSDALAKASEAPDKDSREAALRDAAKIFKQFSEQPNFQAEIQANYALNDAGRIKKMQEYTGIKDEHFDDQMRTGLIAAHEYGTPPYTPAMIKEKQRILIRSGFTRGEANISLRLGITGSAVEADAPSVPLPSGERGGDNVVPIKPKVDAIATGPEAKLLPNDPQKLDQHFTALAKEDPSRFIAADGHVYERDQFVQLTNKDGETQEYQISDVLPDGGVRIFQLHPETRAAQFTDVPRADLENLAPADTLATMTKVSQSLEDVRSRIDTAPGIGRVKRQKLKKVLDHFQKNPNQVMVRATSFTYLDTNGNLVTSGATSPARRSERLRALSEAGYELQSTGGRGDVFMDVAQALSGSAGITQIRTMNLDNLNIPRTLEISPPRVKPNPIREEELAKQRQRLGITNAAANPSPSSHTPSKPKPKKSAAEKANAERITAERRAAAEDVLARQAKDPAEVARAKEADAKRVAVARKQQEIEATNARKAAEQQELSLKINATSTAITEMLSAQTDSLARLTNRIGRINEDAQTLALDRDALLDRFEDRPGSDVDMNSMESLQTAYQFREELSADIQSQGISESGLFGRLAEVRAELDAMLTNLNTLENQLSEQIGDLEAAGGVPSTQQLETQSQLTAQISLLSGQRDAVHTQITGLEVKPGGLMATEVGTINTEMQTFSDQFDVLRAAEIEAEQAEVDRLAQVEVLRRPAVSAEANINVLNGDISTTTNRITDLSDQIRSGHSNLENLRSQHNDIPANQAPVVATLQAQIIRQEASLKRLSNQLNQILETVKGQSEQASRAIETSTNTQSGLAESLTENPNLRADLTETQTRLQNAQDTLNQSLARQNEAVSEAQRLQQAQLETAIENLTQIQGRLESSEGRLQRELDEARVAQAGFEAQMETAQTALSAANEKVADLVVQNTEFSRENAALLEDIAEQTKTIETLGNRLNTLTNQRNQLEEEQISIQSADQATIEAQQAQISELDAAVASTTEKLQAAATRQAELQTQLTQAQESNLQVQGELNIAQNTIETHEATIAVQSRELEARTSQIDQLLRKQAESANATETLRIKHEALLRRLEQARSQSAGDAEVQARLQSQIDTAQARIESLEASEAAQRQSIMTLESEKEALILRHQATESESAELLIQTEAARQDLETLNQELARSNADLETQLSDSQNAQETIAERLAQAEAEAADLRTTNNGLEDALTALREAAEKAEATARENLKKLSGDMASVQQRLEASEAEVSTLSGQLETANGRLGTAENALRDARENETTSSARIAELEQSLAAEQTNTNNLTDQLNQLMAQSADLQSDVMRLGQALDTQASHAEALGSENVQLTQELETARTAQSNLEQQISDQAEAHQAVLDQMQEALTARTNDLEATRAQLEAKTAELETIEAGSTAQVRELQSDLEASQTEIAGLLTERANLFEENQRLTEALADNAQKLSALQNNPATDNTEALRQALLEQRQLNEQVHQLNQRNTELETSLRETQHRLESQSEALTRHKSDAAHQTEELTSVRASYESALERIEALEANNAHDSNQITELAGIRSKLEQDLESVNAELRTLRDSSSETTNTLNREIHEAKVAQAEAQTAIESLQIERTQLSDRVSNLETETRNLTNQLEAANRARTAAEANLSQMQAEREAEREAHAAQVARLEAEIQAAQTRAEAERTNRIESMATSDARVADAMRTADQAEQRALSAEAQLRSMPPAPTEFSTAPAEISAQYLQPTIIQTSAADSTPQQNNFSTRPAQISAQSVEPQIVRTGANDSIEPDTVPQTTPAHASAPRVATDEIAIPPSPNEQLRNLIATNSFDMGSTTNLRIRSQAHTNASILGLIKNGADLANHIEGFLPNTKRIGKHIWREVALTEGRGTAWIAEKPINGKPYLRLKNTTDQPNQAAPTPVESTEADTSASSKPTATERIRQSGRDLAQATRAAYDANSRAVAGIGATAVATAGAMALGGQPESAVAATAETTENVGNESSPSTAAPSMDTTSQLLSTTEAGALLSSEAFDALMVQISTPADLANPAFSLEMAKNMTPGQANTFLQKVSDSFPNMFPIIDWESPVERNKPWVRKILAAMQIKFNHESGTNLVVDGSFGPNMRKATQTFQQTKNLGPDFTTGTLNTPTLRALV